ncbi:SLC13 family permease [Nitrogeniibacter mangrovi]|uniref:SLC13 family permease n=1 Tax=Nitrogeniibacter mangrovi TaxID=2016596 RepID=A0A6C1B8G1_9RHOO|nr:SLC13 family permease [Nitrogeniibacter mangrovi]QID18534.1 SLC13 family permease [Nitrogeniibacter mangrovi]
MDPAHAVLISLGTLLALLVHGRFPPMLLFSVWAGGFHVLGLIDQETLLTSYANPGLAVLVLLMIVSLVLERAPILEIAFRKLINGRTGPAVFKLSAVTALASAFLNNTAVVSALLGTVSNQRTHPPSKLLLPLSYAAVLGGITTLVGTSTNLVVNSFAVRAGLEPIGMFQMAWVGVPVAVACILLLGVLARWLPDRGQRNHHGRQDYFLEARVGTTSPLIGKSIEQNALRNLEGLFLVEIMRDGRLISPVTPEEVLEADDTLIFTGEVDKMHVIERFPGLQVFGTRADALLRSNLVEVVISNESELANRTLREVDFRTMFDAGVVGIRRGEKRLTGQLGRIPLRVGDALLLAVGKDFAQHRNLTRNFHVVGGAPLHPKLSNIQTAWSLGGFALVIALATAGILPLFAGLLLMLGALIATRTLTMGEIRRRFPFELVLVVGGALAIARSLESSGGADLITDAVKAVFHGHGVWGAFVGIYLMTVILTECVTNNAAAALAFPIALSTARAFGADPTPFVMVVAYGASAAFMMPSGYQTHLMVYSPGRYRTLDFVRSGLPMSLLYAALVITLTPMRFPF